MMPEDDYGPILPLSDVPHPSILQSKTAIKQKEYEELQLKKKHRKSRLLPLPEEYRKKHHLKKQQSDPLKTDYPNEDSVRSENIFAVDDWPFEDDLTAESSCGKRRFNVDFADIGWSDWIISPKSFEAHYCAGSCRFNIAKVRDDNTMVDSMVYHGRLYGVPW